MKLWVDDIRKPPDKNWMWVTGYYGTISLLKTGLVKEISLDHDLGTGKTGYDIAKWIEEQVFTNNFKAPEIKCHSQNPVGKYKILKARAAILLRGEYYNDTLS